MSIAINIFRGNTKTLSVALVFGDPAVPYDVTGKVLIFVVKESYEDSDDDLVLTKTVTFVDPTSGIGELKLEHADTDLKEQGYVCEFKLYKADGTFIKTLDVGTFDISKVVRLQIPV